MCLGCGGRERNSPPERVLDLLWLCLPGTGDSTGTAAQYVWSGGGGGDRETPPEHVLVLPAWDRRKHWDSSTVGLRRRKRESETHSQTVCWIYCASTCLEQKTGLEQQHSVGCYCCCYLGGTGEDEKLADLLWLWLSETSECVQCVLGI